jgi:inositol hexakisphosphate/diphosphoinositol-pentakisphosphate kinase
MIRYGGLVGSGVSSTESVQISKNEQWQQAMDYISQVSELNYLTQIVIMLYEDPTKDPLSEDRFHIELHFSPGVNCSLQKSLLSGASYRPSSKSADQKTVITTATSPGSATFSVESLTPLSLTLEDAFKLSKPTQEAMTILDLGTELENTSCPHT